MTQTKEHSPDYVEGFRHGREVGIASERIRSTDLLAAAQFVYKTLLTGKSLEHPDFHVAEIKLQDAIAKVTSPQAR